jgi:hypothetical protein
VVVRVLALVLFECACVLARDVGTVRVIVRVCALVVNVIAGVCAIVIVRARVLDRVLAHLRDRELVRENVLVHGVIVLVVLVLVVRVLVPVLVIGIVIVVRVLGRDLSIMVVRVIVLVVLFPVLILSQKWTGQKLHMNCFTLRKKKSPRRPQGAAGEAAQWWSSKNTNRSTYDTHAL